MGKGAKHVIAPEAERGGVNFTALEGDDKPGLAKFHMPRGDTPVIGMNGKTLHDAVMAWLDLHLKKEPRSIPPEARPNRRVTTTAFLAGLPHPEMRGPSPFANRWRSRLRLRHV